MAQTPQDNASRVLLRFTLFPGVRSLDIPRTVGFTARARTRIVADPWLLNRTLAKRWEGCSIHNQQRLSCECRFGNLPGSFNDPMEAAQ
jgi:hypothetical protein